ncbi:MAG TPA: TVP38/TMEM64 family protein [Candidatus Mcinerneyibacterium sp.]|nr:TVP38/TMEM64 family protein [Candidatus Mcinerneyibacterium sp.]
MKKKSYIFIFLLILILFTGLNIYFYNHYSNIFRNLEEFKEYITSFKYDESVFVFAVILQVILSLLPGQIVGLAGGFIYGPIRGVIYSMLGLLIGSIIAFLLSKIFGRKLLLKLISEKKINKYDNFMEKNGRISLFLFFLFPALPDDLICFIAGLSKINIFEFMVITFLGRLPGFLVLSFIGANLLSYSFKTIFSIGLILITITVIYYKFKKEIQDIILKIIRKN